MDTTTKIPGNTSTPYMHEEILDASSTMPIVDKSAPIPNGFTRRACLWLLTKEEKNISDLIGDIEILGAHPLLTEVGMLLMQAKDKLADWIELDKGK